MVELDTESAWLRPANHAEDGPNADHVDGQLKTGCHGDFAIDHCPHGGYVAQAKLGHLLGKEHYEQD